MHLDTFVCSCLFSLINSDVLLITYHLQLTSKLTRKDDPVTGQHDLECSRPLHRMTSSFSNALIA